MKDHIHNRVSILALLAISGTAMAQAGPELIILSDDEATIPVFGPGTFSGGSFGSDYAINASGDLAINAGIRWEMPPFFFYVIILNNGLYVDKDGTLEPVAIGGEPHPFAGPDEVYAVPDTRAFNNNGQFVFTTGSVRATGPISFEGATGFLMAGDENELRVLARNDRPDLSPELPTGTSYQSFGVLADARFNGDARLNNNDRVVYAATLTGPTVGITNDEIVVDRDGDISTVLLREGDAAPGLPSGVLFGCPSCVAGPSITEPRLNDLDQAIILTRLTGPGVTTRNDQALYVFEDGDASVIARTTGEDASEDRVRLLREPETNERGEVAYRAFFGPLASPRQTLFVGPSSAPVPVLAEGDDAPGLPGFTIDELIFDSSSDFVLPIARPILSATGDVLVAADLAGPGITPFSLNKRALFAGDPADLQLIVRAGSDAPGVPGATFTSVGNFATNVRGDVVFLALLEESGTPIGSVWSWTASEGLRLLGRDGGELPGRGTSFTVERVFFRGGAGQQSGFGSQLSDDGTVLFDANFIGGDGGIYKAQIGSAGACPVDLDGDGEATLFDFLEFQNLFAAGDLAADFDGDGTLSSFDFLTFQNAFDAGC